MKWLPGRISRWLKNSSQNSESAVERSYLICAIARSGSSLLCEELGKLCIAGRPREGFLHWYWEEHHPEKEPEPDEWDWQVSPPEYLVRLREVCSGENGVCGIKVMWPTFEVVEQRYRELYPEDQGTNLRTLLERGFPNLKFISITRKDKLRQAVSLSIARQSGRWSTRSKVRASDVVYSREDLDLYRRVISMHEESWESFFRENQIDAYRVFYEDLVAQREQTLRGILGFLNLDYPVSFTGETGDLLQRQSDGLNEEWIRRYQSGK